MQTVLSNRVYVKYSKQKHEQIERALTYVLPAKVYEGRPVILKDYGVRGTRFFSLPFARSDFGDPADGFEDRRIYDEFPEFPEFRMQLRDTQLEIFDKVTSSVVINAKPGFGKTFLALAIAAKLKRKTLILVHTAFLREQWEGEIQKCLGVTPTIIGGGELTEGNPLITLANVQSLYGGKFKQNDYGLILIDEVHRMPAEVFTSIVDTYKAGVRIGLSGTLGRKDGRDVLITNYISPTILVAKQDNVMIPEINVINTGMKIPFAHSWAHKVSLLIRDTKYLNMLLHITFAALEKGHKILIPSDRLDLLHILHKEIGENSILITSAEGDRTDLTSKLADDFDVILGSRSIFQEGISINNLSALIIATPLNNKFVLEQLVGRIIRKYDGKLTPEVFDLAFHCVTGINQFRTRRHFYESAGYKVNYYRYG